MDRGQMQQKLFFCKIGLRGITFVATQPRPCGAAVSRCKAIDGEDLSILVDSYLIGFCF